MSDTIQVNSHESIAAVHFHGTWRFFYAVEDMFLLDYHSYDPDYQPKPHEERYGTLVVDETNAEQWMRSLGGELTAEQIPHAQWEDGSQVKLTFVIDFDRKFWVGYHWWQDQSILEDYHPKGWIAIEDNVFHYVPDEIAKLWDRQLIRHPIIVSFDDRHRVLISPGTRAGDWGESAIGINVSQRTLIQLSVIRIVHEAREVLYHNTLTDFPSTTEELIRLHVSYDVSYAKQTTMFISYRRWRDSTVLGTIAELGPFQFD